MAIDASRWGLIYKPKAGTRKVRKRWEEIRGYIESRNIPFDYVQSEGYGSVERLARTLANNGYRTIVVVGGDGALNDALNGILSSSVERKSEIALAVIPISSVTIRRLLMLSSDIVPVWSMLDVVPIMMVKNMRNVIS